MQLRWSGEVESCCIREDSRLLYLIEGDITALQGPQYTEEMKAAAHVIGLYLNDGDFFLLFRLFPTFL